MNREKSNLERRKRGRERERKREGGIRGSNRGVGARKSEIERGTRGKWVTE